MIFHLNEKLKYLIELLEASGGVVDEEEIGDAFDQLLDDLDGEYPEVVKLIADREKLRDARKAAAKELSASAKRLDDQASRLRALLQDSLNARGMDKVETAYGTASIRSGGSGSVRLKKGVTVADLPERFVRTKAPEVAKADLSKALKAGDPEAAALAYLQPADPTLSITF